MKIAFICFLLLFLQSLSAQAIRIVEDEKIVGYKKNATTIRVKDSIRIQLPIGHYSAELVRPTNYVLMSFQLDCTTGRLTIPYWPEKDFFYPKLWLFVHSGLYSKWYLIKYKNPKRYGSH